MSNRQDKKTIGDRIDNVIGVFSPERAARRRAARVALRMVTAAHYRGARSSRLTYNWAVGQESADTAMYGELQTLRNRSRDLNRNNAVAAGITDTFCVNAIKTGMKPQARVDEKMVPASPEQIETFQRQAEKIWARWSNGFWADARRKLTFEEIQFLAVRQILESGEFLSVRRALKLKQGRPYMLALDVIEPDRLDTPGRGAGDLKTRFGIEMNDHGEPVKYHIRKTHPGDTFRPRTGGYEYQKVPARDSNGRPIVLHFFPVLRPGQTRGIPFFAPVIEQFKTMADYVEAIVVAARIAACFGILIWKESPYAALYSNVEETDDEGKRIEGIEPGMVEYLGIGEKAEQLRPEQPSTTFDEFVEKLLRMIGASLGLPYELVLKDFSKTNYSSAQAAMLQAYRVFQVWQHMIVNHLCQPCWELLIEEAWLRGELVAPGFRKYQWEYTRARWIPPGWQRIDPFKETRADETAIKMGFKSRAEVVAERGGDWEETAEQIGREKKKFEDLGLHWEGISSKKAAGAESRPVGG